MKTFEQANSTNGIDNYSNFLGDDTSIKDMLIFLGRNRDSGLIDNSNFDVALEALGGESDNVQVHRFGHWACGWFELILINPTATDIVSQAEDMLNALSDYPVLDDSDYYRREYDATIVNIIDSAKWNGDTEITEEQAHDVYSWLLDNNQSALDNNDDTGGYPDKDEIVTALKALNLYSED